MIKNLVQTTLDSALSGKDILVHDQTKSGDDASQYVVYSQSGDSEESFADDVPVMKKASISLKYYYRGSLVNTYAGRQAVRANEELIEASMSAAGFDLPFGKLDAGDVDDIGYFVTVFEFEYMRVI
ncbi:hypothetical protein JR334_02020 [Clostridia bacterium]|nr:hypothetical protein JR334_02020 [Clostridia bacterium]